MHFRYWHAKDQQIIVVVFRDEYSCIFSLIHNINRVHDIVSHLYVFTFVPFLSIAIYYSITCYLLPIKFRIRSSIDSTHMCALFVNSWYIEYFYRKYTWNWWRSMTGYLCFEVAWNKKRNDRVNSNAKWNGCSQVNNLILKRPFPANDTPSHRSLGFVLCLASQMAVNRRTFFYELRFDKLHLFSDSDYRFNFTEKWQWFVHVWMTVSLRMELDPLLDLFFLGISRKIFACHFYVNHTQRSDARKFWRKAKVHITSRYRFTDFFFTKHCDLYSMKFWQSKTQWKCQCDSQQESAINFEC